MRTTVTVSYCNGNVKKYDFSNEVEAAKWAEYTEYRNKIGKSRKSILMQGPQGEREFVK